MKGHGTKFGRKKEEAIAALLTQRNLDEAVKAIGIATNALLKWMVGRIAKLGSMPSCRSPSAERTA
jgi:hypothetical protein